MVKLTRIYTKGGDKGLTSLGRGGRVPKHDPRVEAYGTVDEANSVIGMARAVIARTVKKDRRRHEVEAMLARIQNDLFDLGADLCTVFDKEKKDHRRHEVEAMLARIQNDLFDLGADLCTVFDKEKKDQPALRIVPSQTERLEREIDAMK